MINVYSISEIIEASDKILRSPIKDEDNLPLDGKIIIKKKETDVLINKPLILKNIEKKKRYSCRFRKNHSGSGKISI